jgi:putative membrane protein
MFGFIFMIIIWALIILGAIFLFKKLVYKNTNQNAMNILKERYAKGDITKDQFHEMKKDLERIQ